MGIVIAFNSVWIAIDVDHNHNDIGFSGDPLFVVVEQLFCLFFVIEWCIRFGAFRNKRDTIKDSWFVFDSVMMAMIVVDTWLMNLFMLAVAGDSFVGTKDTSSLKLLRLLRLTRTARMAKLLNAMPELMIMVKGMI